ncbi:ribosomal protein S5-alanine N-acetyltransferase [Vibrio chagasii]|uniref:30S ribosomal protein S5 alanine N-acetyltransferase n=1 Tax=Vibrio chagasii TaxID=170679 RepID=A0A7Y3YLQ7_9VIBR|nr:ribosomal protein S5-alanine N-acetyltransferase [Vibrio chagasii]NOH32819.1 30S ribosomal protein S5 alanine N-acetyltransferase [Vibrio chagasii]
MEDLSTPERIYKRDGNLILRTAEIDDATMISEYFQVNREYLKPWEPIREDAFFERTGWAQRLIKLNELHKMGLGYYCLLINADTNEMLGTISFSNLSRFPFYACNVGYSLAEKAQGHGYMRRGLSMAKDYMFDVQNMHRLMAGYMPHNERSAGVLEHLGFVREGFAKDYLQINGKWEDHILTALVNPNWEDRRNI